jgi:excisionase family DNA binding protein
MFTLTEAAKALGLAPSTLRHQIRNGKLRARKVSRDWYVSEDEVERYRAESRKPTPDRAA